MLLSKQQIHHILVCTYVISKCKNISITMRCDDGAIKGTII